MQMLKWIKRKFADKGTDAEPPVAESPLLHDLAPPRTAKKQGDAHVQAGRLGDAERCYRDVTESDAEYGGALVMLGFVLRAQNRIGEAREVLERAVVTAANDADAHYLLATILEATGPRDREIAHLHKSVDLRPNFELARRQLIVALSKSGRGAEAIRLCQQSLSIFPNSAELHFFLSSLTDDKGLAIVSCQRALSIDPQMIPAQQSLSRLLLDVGQLEQAEASYRREIELTPQHFGPYHMLGLVLNRQSRNAEAVEQFKRAILLNPKSGATYASLGSAYIDLDDTSEENLSLAQENLEKAVALEPGNSECHCTLGVNYWRRMQPELALASFDRAIEADPNNAKARLARVMLWAPAFSSRGSDVFAERSGFATELSKFQEWWDKSETDGAVFVGELQPFFLTYQEENNLALLKQHGEICTRAMQRWLDRQNLHTNKRPLAKRIRLGIVSADIRLHSNWLALIQGWLRSLDRERFELVVFSLSDRVDQETLWARTRADVFIGGPKNLLQWVAAMQEEDCEILLYPGVGLDPMTLKLASLRLAPVQINSWGHADTSGLPTIDYYLSAACFEPDHAQDNYSERLILLPHTGNRVLPLNLKNGEPDYAALNINPDSPILICPGTPHKYQPAHDHLFPKIAKALPNAQLVFFLRAGDALSGALKARITKTFEAASLDISNHVRFVRWLNMQEFHSLLRRADVMLDTIGFSGYNTAVQAIECGLPLITREGRFLRGRLASGVLRRVDLRELIAQTDADYLDLIIRLVSDRPYQMHIRQKIKERRSVLFDDQSAMDSLQDFLESTVRSGMPKENIARNQ